jgi:hypothetical protein
MRYNKQVKVQITVSEKDLCALEDLLSAIPLCDKHKTLNGSNHESEHIALDCPECQKVHDKWVHTVWKIEGKLWFAYINKSENTYKNKYLRWLRL